MELTDIDLLKLAAKAAGLGLPTEKDTDEIGRQYVDGLGLWVKFPWGWDWFNPIGNDSDRYRLARNLGLAVDFTECTVWKRLSDHSLIQEYWGGECGDEAHTIVRAAAEIGKTLE